MSWVHPITSNSFSALQFNEVVVTPRRTVGFVYVLQAYQTRLAVDDGL